MTKKVVITGMGVISPIGCTVEDFSKGLHEGKSGLGKITQFDASELPAQIAAEVKDFEPANYMDAKAAKRMARFTQFAVAAADMAWKDSGLGESDVDPERVSVMLGNGIGGNEVDSDAHERRVTRGAKRIPAMTVPKVIVNEAAGNVSMHLNAKGQVHTLVTACASGTDAIGHALDMIRTGRADVVVTGGTEAIITEYAIAGFCALKALTKDFNDTPEKGSRPFDKDRSGFVMGEGSGILIIESEDHAKKRNAKIYAELAGYGATGDAYHLTAPEAGGAGAARAFKIALDDAGLKPEDVDYINAHGTSTPVNDPCETAAIKTAFGEQAYKLAVSSTKSMTGHCIGAAGAIEAIACILAINESFLPPTMNLDEADPECDLDYVPNQAREQAVKATMSSSLGFGGHNAVIAIRAYEG